jgi:hypothetical protein
MTMVTTMGDSIVAILAAMTTEYVGKDRIGDATTVTILGVRGPVIMTMRSTRSKGSLVVRTTKMITTKP